MGNWIANSDCAHAMNVHTLRTGVKLECQVAGWLLALGR